MSESTPRWTVFCAMIDNFGDIGVCWRLARQLVHEHALKVQLWVDDWSALQRFLAAQPQEPGIELRHWLPDWPVAEDVSREVASSAVVIEAFGCELPTPVKAALAEAKNPPLWINLEYLSAEDWVSGCHGLPSPQNLSPSIRKYFFFPGFETATGGLLRENGLIERHRHWQGNLYAERKALLQDYGVDLPVDALMVSVFSYENPALAGWLDSLAEATEPAVCLIPQGRSLNSLQLPAGQQQPGTVIQRGALTLIVTAFSSQDDYDRLLSLCDFNLVRGEDSFVRAQWAAKPVLWHIYPQDDNVHLAKLQAFMECYLDGLDPGIKNQFEQFVRRWNQGEDCRDLWHYLRPQLPELLMHARKWQQKLAEQPDLATNLVRFSSWPPARLTP